MRPHNAPSLTPETQPLPSSLGLLVLGLTMLLLNLNGAGLFPLSTLVLGLAIMYGGVAQVLVGLLEWRHDNAFGCAAFTSLGLFWLSKIAMVVLPRTGFGQAPQASVMVTYLAMWGVFTFLLFLVTFKLNRGLQLIFGALSSHLLLQAVGFAGGGPIFHLVAAGIGIVAGVTAIYTAVTQGFSHAFTRSTAPLDEAR
ncbi:MAG: acetate uptake transporter [Desulfuromonadales bacterium]|nr:acetate uptake transporter [Desulfuromonadales bacterium]